VPRRPSRCSRAIARYYNLSASHQGLLDATRTSTPPKSSDSFGMR
jgi:hypothetical protein